MAYTRLKWGGGGMGGGVDGLTFRVAKLYTTRSEKRSERGGV